MSNVKFQTTKAQEYSHTPLKCVVNLASTTFDPRMSKTDGECVQPQPSMTLCSINDLTQNQRSDVTALVEEFQEVPQSLKNNRVKRVIKLIDQQSESASKVQETKWNFYSDSPPSKKENATIDILRKSIGSIEPITSFLDFLGRNWETDLPLKIPKTSSSSRPPATERHSSRNVQRR